MPILVLSHDDVRALLQLYGVRDEPQVADLVELARSARKKAWWTAYKNEVPAHYGELIGLEAEASSHKYFQPIAVPGLLQTRSYARAVLRNIAPGELTPEQIDTRVEIRMTRQREVLGQSSPPRLEIVLDEAVLRLIADSPDVMREQLLHLVEVGGRPNVVIQVLPFVAGWFGITDQNLWLAMLYCTLLPTMSAATPTARLNLLVDA